MRPKAEVYDGGGGDRLVTCRGGAARPAGFAGRYQAGVGVRGNENLWKSVIRRAFQGFRAEPGMRWPPG